MLTCSLPCTSKGSEETVKEVLDKIKFLKEVFVHTAANPGLMCKPEKFTDVFGRIEALEGQEFALIKGIGQLFLHKRTTCIIPLLTALESINLRGEYLKNVVIRETFNWGAKSHDSSLVEPFYEHSAITPTVYAAGLDASWRIGTEHQVFKMSLAAADKADLSILQKYKNLETKAWLII